jgi:PAS domain S-box-containing protein
MLMHTDDGAVAVDGTGRILLWNRAAERILGYRAREVSGRTCCEVFGGHREGPKLCHLGGCPTISLVPAENAHGIVTPMRTKTGDAVLLMVSVAVTTAADGARLTVHVLHDVTATTMLVANVAAVLGLLAEGLNTARAAERLHVSRPTIRNHVQNIFGKLGVHSRLEAVAHASRNRLL